MSAWKKYVKKICNSSNANHKAANCTDLSSNITDFCRYTTSKAAYICLKILPEMISCNVLFKSTSHYTYLGLG